MPNPVADSMKKVYILVASAFYLGLCLWLYHGIGKAEAGHFGFALDDPYIHLALAEQIAARHYGINPGQPASPSSSILWPFLLVPFAQMARPPQILLTPS